MAVARPARHRKKLLALYFAGTSLFVLAALELGLRLVVSYSPSYYAAHRDPHPGLVVPYEYGAIRYNSDRFADDEFSTVKSRPRVGYVGDSVCFGIGAGHGHRVTELLEISDPEVEHMNFCESGWWLGEREIGKVASLAHRYELDAVVYFMNLNDVHPGRTPELLEAREKYRFVRRLRNWADALRGRSYLYTHLRAALKNRLVRRGYRDDGQVAYEFYPDQFHVVFLATAVRVQRLADLLAHQGVGFGVVLLPYEMQISQEAELRYRELGIQWGPRFLERGPQRLVARLLPGIPVLDAYEAFVAPTDVEASRSRNALGEFFVYDRGDRVDWNHLNRAGHRRLAEHLHRTGFLARVLGAEAPLAAERPAADARPSAW
jgi:hypothetical protein